jgi:predicted kinase
VLSFKSYLNEGVNDPAIFKAVFLAGGPGSGKSFIVGKTALIPMGFKLINPDPAFEAALKKAGLSMDPEDIGSEKGQEVRGKAKALTNKQMSMAIEGRLGLVIDGTGKDFDKIQKQATELKKIGYDVAMIFVNTDLETALKRNAARARSLPDSMVTDMWKDVQKNIGKFHNLFGSKMTIVDNSDGANYEGATMSAYRRISKWVKEKPTKPAAKAWIKAQKPS